MAASPADIRIVKTSPATEDDARRKAEFDSSMVIVRHRVKFAERDAGEYFFREMMRECRTLALRFNLKIG